MPFINAFFSFRNVILGNFQEILVKFRKNVEKFLKIYWKLKKKLKFLLNCKIADNF